MLHKLSSSYKEIARHLPELNGKISSSDHKKQLLLEMAKKGEPRPGGATRIGQALYSYTRKSSPVYDPKFDKEIRQIRKDWFITSTEKKKQLLLEMAKKGEPRPGGATIIGQALSNYTRKSSPVYDPKFDKEIRQIRKDWFITPTEKANQKRQILLEMAKRGEPRPCIKTPLGRLLSNQTIKSSHSYNPSFDVQIRRIAPKWFITEKANSKKKTLLEMARKGEPRPLCESSLGRALLLYTKKDPKFTKDIRKIRPDWLVSKSEQAAQKDAQNKQALIKMAREGKPKPNFKTYLGYKQLVYTRKSSAQYDPKFTKDIRKIRPDWLVTKIEKGNKKKKILLEMASRGEKKPESKSPLGRSFTRYTIKSSRSCDPKFTRDIRKIRPDWLLSNPAKTNHRKKLLLKMARNGKPRPTQKTSLGCSFCQYTRKSSARYDPKFTKDIRNIRPDWLVTPSEKVNEKKKLLLEMARMGKIRPFGKTPLGRSLINYMTKSSGVYDPVLTKQIKKLAPQWFRKFSKK